MTAAVALTCGDPAGVAPEITFAAWDALHGEVPFFLIGDVDHMRRVGRGLDRGVAQIDSPAQASAATDLPVLHHPFSQPPVPRSPDLANAAAIIASIEAAVAFALSKQVCGITTNPISKKTLADGAGFAHPGHTEFLAALGGVERSVMMLAAPELKVVPATIHMPLKNVPHALTPQILNETLAIMHVALQQDFGIQNPKIAVSGLNPHAGEGGLMGTEDADVIQPAIDRARAAGLQVIGPLPGDTMFHPAARARYDAALCMYHDQALIPIKTLNFAAGVNVTLGLPFVRTSPDHGTAFDIAGRGTADPTSLIEALRLAWETGQRRAAQR